jgi:hypothetical protein
VRPTGYCAHLITITCCISNFEQFIVNSITYLLTHSLHGAVLPEQLTGLQLVKKLPAFHGTRRFITALTSVRHLSVSWASSIQSTYPHPNSWRSIPILSGLAKDLSAPLYNPPSDGAVTPSVPSGLQEVPLQAKAPKEIHAIQTETLACFLPGLAKDLPAPL